MQKMSNRNKENREKQKVGHVAGTKAFARISYDSVNFSHNVFGNLLLNIDYLC